MALKGQGDTAYSRARFVARSETESTAAGWNNYQLSAPWGARMEPGIRACHHTQHSMSEPLSIVKSSLAAADRVAMHTINTYSGHKYLLGHLVVIDI